MSGGDGGLATGLDPDREAQESNLDYLERKDDCNAVCRAIAAGAGELTRNLPRSRLHRLTDDMAWLADNGRG